ncbi:MAG: spore coat protein CotJB [Firmicutes bacterium]|jgi:spore coat protein JB|nr:spore coat protein CotJB [Bacillota bacterium]
MDPVKKQLLDCLQALEFAAIELNLYLDTHPEDTRALADYNQIAAALIRTRAAYEQAYGPLLNYGQSLSHNRWAWLDEPWPWETQG